VVNKKRKTFLLRGEGRKKKEKFRLLGSGGGARGVIKTTKRGEKKTSFRGARLLYFGRKKKTHADGRDYRGKGKKDLTVGGKRLGLADTVESKERGLINRMSPWSSRKKKEHDLLGGGRGKRERLDGLRGKNDHLAFRCFYSTRQPVLIGPRPR